MTNQQTQFLAERLFPEKTFRETADHLLMFDEVTHIMDVFDPAHNPAHSRMVLDAMLERGYSIETHEVKQPSGDIYSYVEFNKKGRGRGAAFSYEGLGKAALDAAEAALKGEEG